MKFVLLLALVACVDGGAICLKVFCPRRSTRGRVEMAESAQQPWFVKTEMFCKPYPVVKEHLEAHRAWVKKLRQEGTTITSGYRVDSEGKPGGGGLMLFAAADYEAALALVTEDPLIANGCVDWQLNQWISEVGGLELT